MSMRRAGSCGAGKEIIATPLDPSKTYSHYQLARAYQRAGRATEAEKEFKLTHELEAKQNSGPSHTPEDTP